VIEQVQRVMPAQWQPYVRPAYQHLRRRLRQLDRAIDRRTLSPDALHDLLRELGITSGATVMVHSSMDEITRRVPGMSPLTLVHLLQETLTADGTLLMPTFPFLGKQRAYVEKRRVFDVARTPSQVGLLTEVFRRLPGVVRSLHPTHSVAAWGRHAVTLTQDHHRGTAFGEASPIYRLRNVGGVVVGLGTGLGDSFTILHVPEEVHPKAHGLCYDEYSVPMTIVAGAERMAYELAPLRTDVQRHYGRVERVLVREGILRNVSRSGLRCAVLDADAFIRRSLALVEADAYLFDRKP
jgi:aminoglycoside 3-N-acetyltransferase